MQAIELYLSECSVFDELYDFKQVEDLIVGKTFVAVIHSRNSNSATFYNTDKDPPVNVNHLIFEHICQVLNVSSMPEVSQNKVIEGWIFTKIRYHVGYKRTWQDLKM